jgi:hypothetical protein
MATEYRNNVSCQKTSAFVLGFNWHFSLFESPFGAPADGVSASLLHPPLLLLAMKRILIPIFFAFAFCPTRTKADDGGYWGTVLQNLAATYVVRLDDGRLLDAEWNSGYDDWSSGDRVILTTDEGEGYIFNEVNRTQVDIFPYDPSDIDF